MPKNRGQWFVRAAKELGRWTAVVGSGRERAEDLTSAKEVRQKVKETQKEAPAPRQETWKTLLKALPLPADTEQKKTLEEVSTEVPWSAWHDSGIYNRNLVHKSSASDSFDDEWCEEEENMDCEWAIEEVQDKFEPRKRKVNEHGEAEPPQVADLNKENV
eukprot:3431652-Amphidinium_carterae.3